MWEKNTQTCGFKFSRHPFGWKKYQFYIESNVFHCNQCCSNQICVYLFMSVGLCVKHDGGKVFGVKAVEH